MSQGGIEVVTRANGTTTFVSDSSLVEHLQN